MTDEALVVDTAKLRSNSQAHAEIAERLSSMVASLSADVDVSHGAIASSVRAALDDVFDARAEALRTVATSGNRLAELLHETARVYDAGDEQAARRL